MLKLYSRLSPADCAALNVQAVSQPSPSAAQRAPWKFSNATQGQLFGAVALGVANLVGVLVLSGYAANPSIRYQLTNSSLSFVPGILPALQVRLPCLKQHMKC